MQTYFQLKSAVSNESYDIEGARGQEHDSNGTCGDQTKSLGNEARPWLKGRVREIKSGQGKVGGYEYASSRECQAHPGHDSFFRPEFGTSGKC